MVAASYPFLDVLWTILIIFVWVAWFMLLFRVFGDIFRRADIGGGMKTLWIIFVVIVPFLGVFIYLIAENDGMVERNVAQAQAQQGQMDAYVRSVAAGGGAATEIEKLRACSTPVRSHRPNSTRSSRRHSQCRNFAFTACWSGRA